MDRVATKQEWAALRTKVSDQNKALFDAGEMPVREKGSRLWPPGTRLPEKNASAVVLRAAEVEQRTETLPSISPERFYEITGRAPQKPVEEPKAPSAREMLEQAERQWVSLGEPMPERAPASAAEVSRAMGELEGADRRLGRSDAEIAERRAIVAWTAAADGDVARAARELDEREKRAAESAKRRAEANETKEQTAIAAAVRIWNEVWR